jgi:hypothetical protein
MFSILPATMAGDKAPLQVMVWKMSVSLPKCAKATKKDNNVAPEQEQEAEERKQRV